MKKQPPARGLLDLIDESIAQEEFKETGTCKHKLEKKTFTIWKGENFERLTWTCETCGRVRGRP